MNHIAGSILVWLEYTVLNALRHQRMNHITTTWPTALPSSAQRLAASTNESRGTEIPACWNPLRAQRLAASTNESPAGYGLAVLFGD